MTGEIPTFAPARRPGPPLVLTEAEREFRRAVIRRIRRGALLAIGRFLRARAGARSGGRGQ